MITKEIKTLDAEAAKLAIYYKGRMRDEIIGIEVLAKDGSVLEWVCETEASGDVKADVTVEVERIV